MRILPAVLLLILIWASPVAAQSSGPGADAGRDCQTIRTCNFNRGGSFRGCISSYSCRVCRYVAAKCTISGRERVCRQSVCTWG